MYKNKVNYKLLNILIVAAIVYIGVQTMDYWISLVVRVFNLLFPFLISFGIAYAFYPIVRLLKRKGVGEKLAITFVVLCVFLIIFGLIGLTVPLIYDQLINLSNNLGTIVNDLSTKFNVNIKPFEENINDYLNGAIMNIGNILSNGFMSFISNASNFFAKFIIISIVSIYLLADMDDIRREVKDYIVSKHKKYFKLLKDIDGQLGDYLEGLIIFMTVQFFEYSFLFWIIGHPNWLLLGFLASFTTVIPYFGGWITNITAVILASVVSMKLFILTLVICLIFPNIDGYIISPHIYGRKTNVKPLISIMSVVIMSGLFGIFGIVIALPTFLVIRCIYRFIKKERIIKLET